jgi:hypothetical protein
VFFFLISVPRSGIATRGFELDEPVGAVEAGANGFEFLVESFI